LPADAGTNPYTGDPEAIAEGREIWREVGCYSCHGGVAEGGVGPSLTDDTWVYKPTDETLFKAIGKGRPGTTMVGWSDDLDDEQIWKLLAYIRSLYRGDPKKIIW
jgi:cytochrome c(L)